MTISLTDKEFLISIMKTPGLSSRLNGVDKLRVLNLVSYLPSHYKLSERIYLAVHDLIARPRCTICQVGEITSFNSSRGYGKYCSLACFGADKVIRKQIVANTDMVARNKTYQNTCLDRYGVDHVLKLDHVVKQAIATKRQKYNGSTMSSVGLDNIRKTMIQTRSKLKQYMNDKYGVDHPMHLLTVKEKIKSTFLARYGVENPSQSTVIRDKTKKTNLARYGTEHFFQNSQYKTWLRDHLLMKYGGFVGESQSSIHQLSVATLMERYGVDNPAKNLVIACKISRSLLKHNINATLNQINMLSQTGYILPDDVIEKHLNGEMILVKHECGAEYESLLGCNFTKCACTNKISSLQQMVLDYVKTKIQSPILVNDRSIIKPKEIDIFIPSLNLGIEIHGHYWHQDPTEYDQNTLHQTKFKMAQAAGITLIQFFEHELTDVRWKSFLDTLLKTELIKLDARKLSVATLSLTQERDFFNQHHLQGYTRSKICLGLIDEAGDVKIALSFGKPRFSKRAEWELIRMASKSGSLVRGGASKLLTRFITDYAVKSIVSYSDNRLSTGKIYQTLGFDEMSVNEPNYWYVKKDKVLSRYECQKHKLSHILQVFDPVMSEYENMMMNHYYKITDAGSKTFIKFVRT